PRRTPTAGAARASKPWPVPSGCRQSSEVGRRAVKETTRLTDGSAVETPRRSAWFAPAHPRRKRRFPPAAPFMNARSSCTIRSDPVRSLTTLFDNRPENQPVALQLLVMGPDLFFARPLPRGRTLTIGRADNVDVQITDPMASRLHARVHVGETGTL